MGKPYGHQYFFSGGGSSTGDMICKKCQQPIFNHSQDWMSYQKSKSYDWSYHCFHRKCVDDQRGWEKYEKASDKARDKAARLKSDIEKVAKSYGIDTKDSTDMMVELAFGIGADLDDHYFMMFGSS